MACSNEPQSSQLKALMEPVTKTLTEIQQSKLSEFHEKLCNKYDVARSVYEEAEMNSFCDQLIAQTATQFQAEISNPLLNVSGLVSELKAQLTKVKAELLKTNRRHRAATAFPRLNALMGCAKFHTTSILRDLDLRDHRLPDEEELTLEAFTNALEEQLDSGIFTRQMMYGNTMMHWALNRRQMEATAGDQDKKENVQDPHSPHQMGSTFSGFSAEAQEEIAGSSSSAGKILAVSGALVGQEAATIVNSDEATSEMETQVEDDDEMLHEDNQGRLDEAWKRQGNEDGTSGISTGLKRKRALSDGTKHPRME